MNSARADLAATPWRPLGLAGAAPWQALTVALFAAALAVGAVTPMPDISWLSVVAERVLHGQRLYSDVLEVNPPLSVLLYAPPVVLAEWLGITPQAATAALCLLALLCSLALSGALLRPLLGADRVRAWKLAAVGVFVLGVLPAAIFGQREHIAVMALLPFLSIVLLRAEGRAPPLPPAILAGLGLGVAVCLKPHFAAAAALPALWAIVRTRTFRPHAEPELWAAASVAVTYGVTVAVCFPDFLTGFMPIVVETYVPVRSPLWLLFVLPGAPLALGAFLIARLMRLDGRWLAVPMLAALGGAAAFFIQGKGWPYHAYPMLAFAVLGLFGAAVMTPEARARVRGSVAWPAMAAIPLAAMVWLSTGLFPGPLAAAVAANAPPSPSLIGVSGVGMELVRPLHARWAGSECIEWISDGVHRLEQAGRIPPAERTRLDALARSERARLGRDIRIGRPDVLLFARQRFDWRAWALKDPGVARELGRYRLAATVGGVEVWTRMAP